jgi:hemerythrin-like domain-containing protein
MCSFDEVVSLHCELGEMFFEHQRALLNFDFQGALDCLAAYERALLEHMRVEEEELLPLYGERVEAERGGAARFFYLEHEKMRRLLTHFRTELPKLLGLPDPTRALLKLLDMEATYKHLVAHHDTREEKFLYPALERITSADERRRLLDGLAA